MSVSMNLDGLAERLDQAYVQNRDLPRLTLEHPALTVDDGYAIQKKVVQYRLNRGDVTFGMKMGLTSKAKMSQMGVQFPIVGVLTDRMRVLPGDGLEFKKLIHPRVEPEVAFVLKLPIRRALSRAEAFAHCAYVCAAIEIIDSRYLNFDFRLPDVLADNCSAAHFVLGPLVAPEALNDGTPEFGLGNLGMILQIDGEGVQFGSSNAIMGHPLESLVELSRMCEARGIEVPAGQVILAGSSTAAVAVERGSRVEVEVQKLGRVAVDFR
ncbi:MAG: 2-keto-4-pentenoate hydratase [Bacteriovoracia bacterium]